MVNRMLMVGKFLPEVPESEALERVHAIFAKSDASDLPDFVGVNGRSVFRCGDLYLHLIESDHDDLPARVQRSRTHPLFQEVHSEIIHLVRPLDPVTWSGPSDSMSNEFYTWPPARGLREQ